jgi:hypothetical protein
MNIVPPPRRIRNLPVILLATMLLAFSIYTLFWYAQLRVFKTTVAAMQNGQGTLFDIEAQNTEFSGFPYRLQARFTNARLVRQRSDYMVSLQAPTFEMTRLLWSPGHWVLMADEPKVSFRSRGGSAPLQLAFAGASLQSSLRYDPQKIERLSFEFTDVRWSEGHRFAEPITFKDLQLHLRDSTLSSADPGAPTPKTIFANLRLVAGGMTTAGSAPLNMDFYADLTGGTRLDDSAPALARWQAGGGRLVINRFLLVRPGLEWRAEGTLGLAASGRLTGSGALKTNAPAQTLMALKGVTSPATLDKTATSRPWQLTDGTLLLGGAKATDVPLSLLEGGQ